MKKEFSRRSVLKMASAVGVAMATLPQSVIAGKSRQTTGMVPTARGDMITLDQLGFTLPTELIIQETPGMSLNWPDYTWGALPESEQIAKVVDILNTAHEQAGVDTIIDRTIMGIGRNVPRMQKIAQQTPVNILVTTGWYALYELPYYFHYRERFPEMWGGQLSLEDFMVRDIEVGIADTGVRAAAIKVISDKYGINTTPDVLSIFQASARAHRRTGAPILTHSIGIEMATHQLEVLSEQGVDLARVVLGHMDRTPANTAIDDFERLMQRGSFMSFDGWWGTGEASPVAPNAATPEQNLLRVMTLLERGYGDQILLSTGNVAFADSLPKIENSRAFSFAPYTQLALDIVPKLKELGASDSQIESLTVTNPRRMLESLGKGGY